MHATEFVESYFDAWNHADARSVADHLAANGIYCDVPENVQRSRDELISNLTEFFSNDKHQYLLVGEIITGRDTIAFQYETRPVDEARNASSTQSYRGAEFMTFNGDAALTITDYYEMPGATPRSSIARLRSPQAQKRKYAKSGLNGEQMREYKFRLDQVMTSKKIYLRPDLTLPKLAEVINCSVNHLSQVINSGFGMSFFDYLNQHRIAHARKLLTRLDDRKGAILNVAFTVGFNSNSAFYAAFKKSVGQTPAQYRRTQVEGTH